MSTQTIGILLGGVLPALFLAWFNIFQKYSAKSGISGFYFMLIVGLTISAVCAAIILITGDRAFTWRGGAFSLGAGFLWVSGVGFISYTLRNYEVPLAKLAPLYNANTLIVVLLSLFIFAEWQQVNIPKTIIATLMIVGGSILLTR